MPVSSAIDRPADPLLRGEYFYGNPCGGSSDSCRWTYPGATGFPASARVASQSDVVVGVEVAYAAPSAPRPVQPIEPVGGSPACLKDSECPPTEVCQQGVCVDLAPPVPIPGAVYGITKLYCADAVQVAMGANTPTATVPTSFDAPTGIGVSTGTLSAPAGAYALDGFQIVFTSDGATQLAATYRRFAHDQNSRTRTVTAFLPSKPSPSSQSDSVGCYRSSNDLYLSGVDQAETQTGWSISAGGHMPQLGSLSLGCTDYTNVFQMPDAQKVACCLGRGGGCWWGGYTPQSKKCDDVMAKYCRPLCSGGTCADQACNCLGSPLAVDGVAQCFDTRCANNTGAYRTGVMSVDSQCPGKGLTCAELAALGGGAYVAVGVRPPTGCGGSPDEPSGGGLVWLEKNPIWAVVFVVFVILLAFALMPSGGGPRSRDGPKLPPGALPALPPLAGI